MRARLSYVTIKRSGARAVRDVHLDVEQLRIGRGTHNEIQLSGLAIALDHAALHRRGVELWVEALRGDDLRVNGRLVSSGVLVAGDVVRIGQHELRIVAPVADEELALEIEQIESGTGDAEALAKRTRMGVTRMLPRRAIGWLSAAAVAGLAFAWPLAVDRGAASFELSQLHDERPSLERRLAASLSSGPLSSSHAHFGDRCVACHVNAFDRVPDEACQHCHGGIGAHTRSTDTPTPAEARRDELAASACIDCHHEHRGEAALTDFPAAHCVNCHAEDLPVAGADEDVLLRAVDFASDHPEFRPLVALDAGSTTATRVSLADAPKEQSGLRFPHDKHLVAGLKAPDGDVTLACTDCHTPDARGTTMQAIEFERTCRRCHSLAFDARYPERQALHGKPAKLTEDLFEFYATQGLRGAALDEQAPEIARRRPGRDLTEEERATVLEWVGQKTARVARFLLDESRDESRNESRDESHDEKRDATSVKRGICSTCHTLERADDEVFVLPVHVVPFEGSPRWFSKATFRHDDHTSAECESCHDARNSASATAVLLPNLARCRDCHGGAEPRLGKLTSPCTQCHDFHRERFGAMHPDATTASGGKAAAAARD